MTSVLKTGIEVGKLIRLEQRWLCVWCMPWWIIGCHPPGSPLMAGFSERLPLLSLMRLKATTVSSALLDLCCLWMCLPFLHPYECRKSEWISMCTHIQYKFINGRSAEKREEEVWMDQIVKYCINKKPQMLIQPQGRREQWTMDFTRLLSLLFTENCTVTRANATSDELSVIYMTSPSVKHTCKSQSHGLVFAQMCLLLD